MTAPNDSSSRVDAPRDGSGSAPGRRIALGLAALAIGLLCLFQGPLVERLTYYPQLTAYTESLIDASLTKNEAAFFLVSGVKAGLAIVEDSAVGVGVHLELGDIVQSVYDYVDFVWQLFLYALLLMGLYKLLMSTGLLGLGVPIIGASLCAWGLGLLLPEDRGRRLLRDLSRITFVVGLVLLYVFPLSLIAANYVQVHYTADIKEENLERIRAFKADFDAMKDDVLELKSRVSLLDPAGSAAEIGAEMTRILNRMVTSVQSVTSALMFYAVLVLFDVLFVPLIVGYILTRLAGRLLDRLLPFGRSSSAPSA